VPRAGLFDVVEVERGREAETISVKMDVLMGTADDGAYLPVP